MYFRKDFRMLLAVKEGEIYSPHQVLGNNKAKEFDKKKNKKKNPACFAHSVGWKPPGQTNET